MKDNFINSTLFSIFIDVLWFFFNFFCFKTMNVL